MGLNPFQSLRVFAASQPPLLVFTVCLMAFGLTMVILAYLIGETDLPNPDVAMDWNIFLEQFVDLPMCINSKDMRNSSNAVESRLVDHVTTDFSTVLNFNATNGTLFSKSKTVDRYRSMGALLPDIVHSSSEEATEGLQNVSVSVNVILRMATSVLTLLPSQQLFGAIQGRYLGILGKVADEYLNVTMTFPPVVNTSSCGKSCDVSTCLTFQGLSLLLPRTRRPPMCHSDILPQEGVAVAILDHHQEERLRNKWCQSGTRLNLGYTADPELTVMLTIRDRSIVNLHLMHTSYFLFVMVMTLLCYALIRGRYRTPKLLPSEKIPLEA